MRDKPDFEFFRRTLEKRRRLKMVDGESPAWAVNEMFWPKGKRRPKFDTWDGEGLPPKHVLEGTPFYPQYVFQGEDCAILDSANYARSPGTDLSRLRAKLGGVTLPEDFLAFHREFAEALLVTCGGNFHIWSEDQILASMDRYRDYYPIQPRFFRFASYYDVDQLSFGLWKEHPERNTWRILSLSAAEYRDQDLDLSVISIEDFYVANCGLVGVSFISWLADTIHRDGRQRYLRYAPENITELNPADPLPDGRIVPLGG